MRHALTLMLAAFVTTTAIAGGAPSKERIRKARAAAEARQQQLDESVVLSVPEPQPQRVFDGFASPTPVMEPGPTEAEIEARIKEAIAMAELNRNITLLLESAEASESRLDEIEKTIWRWGGGGSIGLGLVAALLKFGVLAPKRKED